MREFPYGCCMTALPLCGPQPPQLRGRTITVMPSASLTNIRHWRSRGHWAPIAAAFVASLLVVWVVSKDLLCDTCFTLASRTSPAPLRIPQPSAANNIGPDVADGTTFQDNASDDLLSRAPAILSSLVLAVAVWLSSCGEVQAEVAGLKTEKAEVKEEVTGFADFAEKGGAMTVDPACFITSCGKQTKECFVEDSRCLKGALCLSRCRGGQDCATQCFAEYGCKRLDAWLNCTVEREQCVSTPASLIDTSKWFKEDIPTKQPNFDPASLQGKWFKVRGYNPKYDCYLCQPNTFDYKPGADAVQADVQLRVERLSSGGQWQNNVKENLRISPESAQSTFVARGEIFGLSFDEEWYVLAGDDDFKLVAYKGKNLQDVYKGGFIYTRTPELSSGVEAKARQAAEAAGYVWSKFCVVDNACPVQKPVPEGAATLGWDDIPDLIEWFAPGTFQKQKSFTGTYK